MKHAKGILLAMSFIVAAACNNGKDRGHGVHEHMAHSGEEGHEDHAAMSHGEPTDMSVYNLNSSWRTQDGGTLTLQDLQGKVQLMAMVYTTCKYACPRIVADLKHIQDQLQQKGIDNDAHFVLVSIDPKVDTVARLKAFARDNDMNADEWTLLNGSEGDVMELAALLGVKYKKTGPADYAHSNVITVLDQHGEIAYQQTGLGSDAARTIEVIEVLVR